MNIKEDGLNLGYDDVSIAAESDAYDGFFSIRSLELKHRLHPISKTAAEPQWSGTVHRECFMRNQVASVLPYHLETDSVVLNEEFRIGAQLQSPEARRHLQSPWLLEIVAGICESGEDPEATARREAAEEAGLEIDRLELVHRYLPSPGGSNEFINLYCGLLRTLPKPGIFGLDSENENIRTHVLKRTEALELLTSGRICNAATIIALQWLELNRTGLTTS